MIPEFQYLTVLGLPLVCTLMFIFWLIQVKTKNAGIIDLGWTLSLVVLADIYYVHASGYHLRKLLILSMVALWGVRLGGLILQRLIKDTHEDPRYVRVREEWKTNLNLKFFFLFQFQALLAFVLSIPFMIIAMNPCPGIALLEWVAVGVWLVGFLGESIADKQLKAFKADPKNKGQVCQVGLWNYSRHPNYFFEWVIWISYFIFALASPKGWLGIISPIIMYVFLTKLTGVPFAETQALKSKGEAYRKYQESTSFFIPLPKKK